eukprot:scaffold11739_cov31-Tisochrysis_lutea.AAC.1
MKATRSAPRTTTPSICETSNRPADSRVCRIPVNQQSVCKGGKLVRRRGGSHVRGERGCAELAFTRVCTRSLDGI